MNPRHRPDAPQSVIERTATAATRRRSLIARRLDLPTKTALVCLSAMTVAPPALAQEKANAGEENAAFGELTDSARDGVAVDPSAAPGQARPNRFWWPGQLDLSSLRDHDARSNPLGEDFDYAEAFGKLDLDAVKADVGALLTDSQDWWPADFGHYGPFFIRLSWHSAGTYRTLDGRGWGDGGQMRFDPLNSWPDNGNLDKARRLLWPVKRKYGERLSWADLLILAGTVGLENMGFETYGFAGGRTDDWEPDLVYWGPETAMLGSDREGEDGELQRPLGATHMGLIYVNPEGPEGVPDPVASAANIRLAFGRMAMSDEETVALIAGGHTFGKMHGARKVDPCLGAEPATAAIENQGLGWQNDCGKGHAEDTTTSGLEGAWTQAPTRWTTLYLENLLGTEWEQAQSPAGGVQWTPTDASLHRSVPDAHVEGRRHAPVMTTADLALKFDPAYAEIARRFLANPEEFQRAFAKAWYKLTHRDMGPRARYLGDDVPETLLWQDPIPAVGHELVDADDVEDLKRRILATGLTVPELVRTAWASASSYRDSDMRGGANGARVALAPQKDWAANDPDELARVIARLQEVREGFNASAEEGVRVSLADLVVLGGAAAIEKAAEEAGVDVEVPFVPGRADATAEQTDVESFALLEPTADAFRNYFDAQASYRPPTEMLIDKADQLSLTVPETVVLLGGMRALDANAGGADHGVLTDRPGTLSNDFFVNLMDMSIRWEKAHDDGLYQGVDRDSGEVRYTATPVDLIFGANAELRAIAETYAFDGARTRFVEDFVDAWIKVMRLDRFDLDRRPS